MAKEGDEFKAAAVCFFFGGLLVWQGLRRLKRKRIVEDTASIDIASAAQGLCEIQGFAWPLAGTSLTLQGRKAIYHQLKLEKHVKQGKSSSWKTQWQKEHKMPFYVIDHSGAVLVNPAQAEVEVKADTWNWSQVTEKMRANIPALGINVAGFPPATLFFGITTGKYRFRETSILLGAPVYVHGTLQAPPRDSSLPSTLPIQRFRNFLGRIQGKKVHGHLGFDLNRDGKVCEDEAERALNEIGEKAFEEKREGEQPPLPGSSPPENRIYGQVVSCSERKLYIADCHQEHLLRRIGSNNILMILIGACLIGLGAFLVAAKMGFR